MGTGHGLNSINHLQLDTACIGLYTTYAKSTFQSVLIISLEPYLTDVANAPISVLFARIDIINTNPTDITQCVSQQVSLGIMARQLRKYRHS